MGRLTRVQVTDSLLLACDACQARAGFGPTLLTLLGGWFAPKGPKETLAVVRDNGAQQRRYGSAGATWRALAFGGAGMVLSVPLAVGTVGAVAVIAIVTDAPEPPSFVESMSASADVRARARRVPLGLAEGSEPPASTAAGLVLDDIRLAWPGMRVGVRVDLSRGAPERGEIAGRLERIECVVNAPEANRFPEAQQRIVLRAAALTLRSRLGDVTTRVRLFGADGRGPGALLEAGASEPVELPVADVR